MELLEHDQLKAGKGSAGRLLARALLLRGATRYFQQNFLQRSILVGRRVFYILAAHLPCLSAATILCAASIFRALLLLKISKEPTMSGLLME